MKKNILSLVLLLTFGLSFSQGKKKVLLTVNDKPVYTSEFKRVYNKNLDLVKDESQKSVDGYMDLFVDYQLKIREAYNQGLDKEEAYLSEYKKYSDQLSRNYIFEDKVSDQLTKEAYNRGLEEVSASHILIKVGYEDTPQDTLKAYNKIMVVYNKAKAGEDFETLTKKYSEEPNIEKSGGKLGYFSAFAMVYPFESMAYNTKVGDVSEIVRTKFGYHIIKVSDRRKREGQVIASHIMVSTRDTEVTFDPEERINEIYALLQQGETFESLAMQYSDDKMSGKKGGKLNPFRRGDLRATNFEDAVYELEKPGDIAEPMKTYFGWHIIRLEEKVPLPSYEDEFEQLDKRVKGGLRSKIVISALNDKIKSKYPFAKITEPSPFFDSYITDDFNKKKWIYDTIPSSQDKVLFTIGDRELRFNDFAQFLSERQKGKSSFKLKNNIISEYYGEFETAQLKKYYKDNLELENEEYAGIIEEYRNGLLIFDVMNKNIWQKAKNDTTGLKVFYEANKEDYRGKIQADADIFALATVDLAKSVQAMLGEGKSPEVIKQQLNVENRVNALLSSGKFEDGNNALPKDFDLKVGVSSIYEKHNRFTVVNVNEIVPPRIKTLKEVKGRVMSNYQNFLEKEWMDGLRKKYTVEINKKALKKIKKEFKS